MKAPSKTLTRELQVGLFLITGLVVIFAFSFNITDSPIFRRGTQVTAYLNDATGLFLKSKVKMAGINVGIVKKIELENSRARITLLIDEEVELPAGVKVVPRPLGILGDKYIDIVLPKPEGSAEDEGSWNGFLSEPEPAPDTESEADTETETDSSPDEESAPTGARLKNTWQYWVRVLSPVPSAQAQAQTQTQKQSKGASPTGKGPKVREGDVLPTQNSGATLDDLTREMSKVMADMQVISSTLRRLLEGKDKSSTLGRTLHNAEQLTSNLNSIVVTNKQDIGDVLRSLTRMLRKMESVLQNLDQGELGGDLQALARSADNLGRTLKHVESIAGKIDRGEGTLGRLVNDPVTATELNKSLLTINASLDQAQRTRLIVEALPEYGVKDKAFKTYIGLKLAPQDHTAYLGQIVVDNQGRTIKKITRETVDGGAEKVTVTEEQDLSQVRFSLQYIKRFWNTGVRFGLFENTGGAALDQHLFRDTLQLSAEIYNFSAQSKPQIKAFASAQILEVFKIYVGADRLLDNPTMIVGLGLSFSDEDLKTVLLLPGVP